jgi:hypothetical protein
MVTPSHSQQLYRFTVHYTEAASLSRILDALFRAGAEPSWLFTRLSRRKCFRVDLRVEDLPDLRVETLAARLRAMPSIQSVKFKAFVETARPMNGHVDKSTLESAALLMKGAGR